MSSHVLPLFVDIAGARVVITGATAGARELALRLAEMGARVRLVASPAQGVDHASVETVDAAPSAAHLEGALLLVTASAEASTDAAIAQEAERRGVLVVSRNGARGRAHLGRARGTGALLIAASTGGASPELEERLAREAATALTPEHARFAEILADLREKLEERFPDVERRTAIWQDILDSPVLPLLNAGSDDEAVELAQRMAWGTG